MVATVRSRPVLVRSGKECGGLAGQPIGRQADPLAYRDLGTFQALNGERRKPEHALLADTPIHGVGLYRKTSFAEQADRARHVKGRSDQQPSRARLWLCTRPCEFSILDGVA